MPEAGRRSSNTRPRESRKMMKVTSRMGRTRFLLRTGKAVGVPNALP